jgi:cobalt/nickel transport system permease protein
MFAHAFHPIHSFPSYLARIDPRARITAALVLALIVALERSFVGMALATMFAAGLVVMAQIPLRDLIRRLLPLEILVAVLMIVLPFPRYDHDGLMLAICVALKANAVALAVTALIGTMDAVTLGHALNHFHVPQKLTQLMLFMVRYFDVLGREYARLRAAMRVRCFRPAMNGHSYRTFGYLVGILLVRSFDRSERVLAAMKCRGFCGRYYMLDHFAFVARRDGPFYAAVIIMAAVLLGLEWI